MQTSTPKHCDNPYSVASYFLLVTSVIHRIYFERRLEHTIFRWFCSTKRKCLIEVEAALYASVDGSSSLISVRATERPISRQANINNKQVQCIQFSLLLFFYILLMLGLKRKPTGGIGPGCKKPLS